METIGNVSEGTENKAQTTSWIKSGCACGFILNDKKLREMSANISRAMVMNLSPEMRAIIMATSIIHQDNFLDICRMVMVANESGRIDNTECYAKVLRLMHAQIQDKKTRTKIIQALSLLPSNVIMGVYISVFEEKHDATNKKNFLGRKEADDFLEDCLPLITGKSIPQKELCTA